MAQSAQSAQSDQSRSNHPGGAAYGPEPAQVRAQAGQAQLTATHDRLAKVLARLTPSLNSEDLADLNAVVTDLAAAAGMPPVPPAQTGEDSPAAGTGTHNTTTKANESSSGSTKSS
jgi:hypothetical protein